MVGDSTIQTLLGVSTTASAPVSPVFMENTAVDRQIVYSLIDGNTDPGMNSQKWYFDISDSGSKYWKC